MQDGSVHIWDSLASLLNSRGKWRHYVHFYLFRSDDEDGISNFTYHWSVHVPECSFLTVENFPLNFVSFLVHSEKKKDYIFTAHVAYSNTGMIP